MTGVQTCALPICFPVTIHRIMEFLSTKDCTSSISAASIIQVRGLVTGEKTNLPSSPVGASDFSKSLLVTSPTKFRFAVVAIQILLPAACAGAGDIKSKIRVNKNSRFTLIHHFALLISSHQDRQGESQSLLDKSPSIESPNCTSGLRESKSYLSLRYVVISTVVSPRFPAMVPNSIPVSQTCSAHALRIFFVSKGRQNQNLQG